MLYPNAQIIGDRQRFFHLFFHFIIKIGNRKYFDLTDGRKSVRVSLLIIRLMVEKIKRIGSFVSLYERTGDNRFLWKENGKMTYEELVSEIRNIFMKADVSGIKEHLAYQFNVTGEAEGAFYAEVSEGKLSIEPYEYYDRDVVFTMTADTLLKIAKGELDAVFAYTTGKLKVDGSIEKALLLQKFGKGNK